MAENEKLDLYWRHSARWLRTARQFMAAEENGLAGELDRALRQTFKNVERDPRDEAGITVGDLFEAAADGPDSARRRLNGFSKHRDYIDLIIETGKSDSPRVAARNLSEIVVDRFLSMAIVDDRIKTIRPEIRKMCAEVSYRRS